MKDLTKITENSLIYPYCSASSFHYLDGKKVPENFGSNCYDQTNKLRQILILKGYVVKFIEDIIVKRHRSIICYYKEKIYYINPYFMCKNPILISDNEFDTQISSYPIIPTESKINLTKKGNMLFATKTWPTSNRTDSFLFNLDHLIDDELSKEEYLNRSLHIEQKNLSLRVIDTNNGDVLNIILDFNNLYFYTLSSEGKFYEDDINFVRIANRIGLIINSSINEIKDYILKGYYIRQGLLKNIALHG